MKKSAFFLLVAITGFEAISQSSEDLIELKGKFYSAEDSSTIKGQLIYEKLPYYDDMGIGTSTGEGDYKVYLVRNELYNLRVSGPGHEDLSEEIKTHLDDELIVKDFYLLLRDELRLISLENLNFARNRSTINSESYDELNGLADWLMKRKEIVIQLEGHTDFQGNSAANMRLSQDRVDAVKDYLTNKGVKKNRIQTKAFGGTQPLTTDRTDEAKARNRRVEVRIIKD